MLGGLLVSRRRRSTGISRWGLVYCLVFEARAGDKITTKDLERELLARRLLTVSVGSTIHRALRQLERARFVKRDPGRGDRGEVVYVRQDLPKKLTAEQLVLRGAPWQLAIALLRCLQADRLVELRADGVFHDTRESA